MAEDDSIQTRKGNLDKSFVLPKHEEHLIHVSLEIKSFDPATGVPTSKPFVQSYYPKEFDKMEAEGHFKGYSVEVLHDPRRDSQKLADKVMAGIKSPIVSPNLDKPLEDMSNEELALKYAELYKEEAPSKAVQFLRDAIEDKIVALRNGVTAAADVHTAANPEQGILNDGVRDGSTTEQALTDQAQKQKEDAAAENGGLGDTKTGRSKKA